jgi:hypothetical protein
MNKKKQFFKTILIFTSVVVLLIVGTIITLLFSNSRQQDISSDYDITFGVLINPIKVNSPSNLDTELNATTSDLKTSNTVYMYDLEDKYFPSQKLALNTASYLKLDLVDEVEKDDLYFNNPEGNTILSYNNTSKTIYIGYFSTSFQEGILPSEEEVVSIAKEKLQELNLWPEEDQLTSSLKYYFSGGGEYAEIDDKKIANTIGVNFKYKIQDFPVIANNLDDGSIEVLIDNTKQIRSITYTHRPLSTTETATYPIISLETALTQIQYRNAEMILPFEGVTPKSLTIEEVEFAYRILYEDQQYLQPVYVFEGTDDNSQKITLIVAAVEGQYLSDHSSN